MISKLRTTCGDSELAEADERELRLAIIKWKYLTVIFVCGFIIAGIVIVTLVSTQFSNQTENPATSPTEIPNHRSNATYTDKDSNIFPQIEDSVALPLGKLRFVERSEWGAQPPTEPLAKLNHPVPYVIISHTATNFCKTQAECTHRVRFAQTFQIESRNWSDIGYNFLVGGDGYAYVGRSWDFVGVHSYNYNTRSIGISFIGTFNSVIPPDRQLHAAQELIKLGVKMGKIATDYKLLGHRQISETVSPGDGLYNVIKTWPHWSPAP